MMHRTFLNGSLYKAHSTREHRLIFENQEAPQAPEDAPVAPPAEEVVEPPVDAEAPEEAAEDAATERQEEAQTVADEQTQKLNALNARINKLIEPIQEEDLRASLKDSFDLLQTDPVLSRAADDMVSQLEGNPTMLNDFGNFMNVVKTSSNPANCLKQIAAMSNAPNAQEFNGPEFAEAKNLMSQMDGNEIAVASFLKGQIETAYTEQKIDDKNAMDEQKKQTIIKAAENDLKGIDPSKLTKPGEKEQAMGKIMMKHGVTITEEGGKFVVDAPTSNWEITLNKLMGFSMLVGGVMNKLGSVFDRKGAQKGTDKPSSAPTDSPEKKAEKSPEVLAAENDPVDPKLRVELKNKDLSTIKAENATEIAEAKTEVGAAKQIKRNLEAQLTDLNNSLQDKEQESAANPDNQALKDDIVALKAEITMKQGEITAATDILKSKEEREKKAVDKKKMIEKSEKAVEELEETIKKAVEKTGDTLRQDIFGTAESSVDLKHDVSALSIDIDMENLRITADESAMDGIKKFVEYMGENFADVKISSFTIEDNALKNPASFAEDIQKFVAKAESVLEHPVNFTKEEFVKEGALSQDADLAVKINGDKPLFTFDDGEWKIINLQDLNNDQFAAKMTKALIDNNDKLDGNLRTALVNKLNQTLEGDDPAARIVLSQLFAKEGLSDAAVISTLNLQTALEEPLVTVDPLKGGTFKLNTNLIERGITDETIVAADIDQSILKKYRASWTTDPLKAASANL